MSEINEMKDLTLTSNDEFDYKNAGIEKIESRDSFKQIKKDNKFSVVLLTGDKNLNKSNRVAREFENFAREQKDTLKNLSGTEELVKFCVFFDDDGSDDASDDESDDGSDDGSVIKSDQRILIQLFRKHGRHDFDYCDEDFELDCSGSKWLCIEDFWEKRDTEFSPSAIKSILTSNIKKLCAKKIFELPDRESFDNFLTKHEKVIIHFSEDGNVDSKKYQEFVAKSTSNVEFAVVDCSERKYRSCSDFLSFISITMSYVSNTSTFYGFNNGTVISRNRGACGPDSGTGSDTGCEIPGLEQLVLEVEDPEILTKGKVLEIFDENQFGQVFESHNKIIVHFSIGHKDELVDFNEKYQHFVAEHSAAEILFAVVRGKENEQFSSRWEGMMTKKIYLLKREASSFFYGFVDCNLVSKTGETFEIADLENLFTDVKEPEKMIPFKASLGIDMEHRVKR